MERFLKVVVGELRSLKWNAEKRLNYYKLDIKILKRYLISLLTPKETIYALELLIIWEHYLDNIIDWIAGNIPCEYAYYDMLKFYHKVIYPAVALAKFSVDELRMLKDYKPPEEKLKALSKFIKEIIVSAYPNIEKNTIEYIAEVNGCNDTEAILKWLVKNHDEIYCRSLEIFHQFVLKCYELGCEIAGDFDVEELHQKALELYKKLMGEDWHLGLGGKCVAIYYEDSEVIGFFHPYCYKLFLESKKNKNE
jgi:hypothetical protein